MKKLIAVLLSAVCAVSTVACGSTPPASSSSASPADAPAAPSESESVPQQAQQEPLSLYIGSTAESQVEVPCTTEKTPEALLAALAAETGWNLSVVSITENVPVEGALTVVLAADSSLYSDPPVPQKEEYHVFDAEDWVYTVCNSISETLTVNLGLVGVAFASPEGGPVVAGNEFVKVHLDNNELWDTERVLLANPLVLEDPTSVL